MFPYVDFLDISPESLYILPKAPCASFNLHFPFPIFWLNKFSYGSNTLYIWLFFIKAQTKIVIIWNPHTVPCGARGRGFFQSADCFP